MRFNALLQRWVKRLPRLLLELTVFLAILLGAEAWLTRNALHGPVPPLVAATVDGTTVDLRALRGPGLIYFWATWCPVCRAEQGTLQGLTEDYPVVTVALQSGDDGTLQRYLQEHHLRWKVINDPDGSIARQFGVVGVPAAFVVGADGAIHYVTRGYTTGLGMRLRLLLARLDG